METRFIEAVGTINWGKFMLGRFTAEEWARRSKIDESESSLLWGRGWDENHVLVLDLQTGEGAIFMPGGYAKADLDKHKVWVCPMFEPFLEWLYKQDWKDFSKLPDVVDLKNAPGAMFGYRREGQQKEG